MSLPPPPVDERDFEQMLAEAKRRIPVTTPEWTNFEIEGDPGLTLIELFAFITDNLLYSANRIPERNRRKFLQLLDIPLQKAAPAEGIVQIVNERGPLQALVLEPGVRLAAGNISFLTRDGVTVLPVEGQTFYKRRISRDDPQYQEFLDRYEAIRLAEMAAAGEAPGVADVQLDSYETTPLPAPKPGEDLPAVDVGVVATDRSLYVALLAPRGQTSEAARDAVRAALGNSTLTLGIVPALEGQLPPLLPKGLRTPPGAQADLIVEMPDTSAPAGEARYRPLTIVRQDDVLSGVGLIQVILPQASELRTWDFSEPLDEGAGNYPPRLEDDALRERLITWVRLRMAGDQSGSASNGRITWVGINAVSVVQSIPVTNEPLGTGTGEPHQSVVLAHTPVLEETVKLEVQQSTDGGWEMWRLVTDLYGAGEGQKVFTLDPASGVIDFGGVRGARPGLGQAIRASYAYGGGRQGMVAIGAISTSDDVRLGGGFKISNPIPTWGGSEGETVAQAEERIPRVIRHRDRLVTEPDFEDITRRTPGVDVGRAEVLSVFHPERPDEDAPGVVTVMVVPAHDPLNPRHPTPDRLFLRRVCDYLDERRLITTEIYVRGPLYRSVSISVGVRVRAGYVRDQVIQQVRQRLEEYLSALPPGGPDGDGWPLGRALLQKDLEAVATRVPGVEFVEGLELGVDTALGIERQELTGLELPRLVAMRVREGVPDPLAEVVGPQAGALDPDATRYLPVPVSRAKC